MRNNILIILFALLFVSAYSIEWPGSNCDSGFDKPTIKTFEKDGNIYFEDSSGKQTQITKAGVDSEPSLSADNKLVMPQVSL
ncbi:MAG: hypothetical protein H8E25_05645 [Planctomycetes bacterium]|nr:hypothetical protein [Planctomycetota bacterium]